MPGDGDPHDEIARLEAHIEDLTAKLESCRKLALAARIAMVCGAVLLVCVLFGVIGFDPRLLLAAITALLGGIVVWGSNVSTAKEASNELAAAEAQRATQIGLMQLRVVGGTETLH